MELDGAVSEPVTPGQDAGSLTSLPSGIQTASQPLSAGELAEPLPEPPREPELEPEPDGGAIGDSEPGAEEPTTEAADQEEDSGARGAEAEPGDPGGGDAGEPSEGAPQEPGEAGEPGEPGELGTQEEQQQQQEEEEEEKEEEEDLEEGEPDEEEEEEEVSTGTPRTPSRIRPQKEPGPPKAPSSQQQWGLTRETKEQEGEVQAEEQEEESREEREPQGLEEEWTQEVKREHEAELRAELLQQYRALVQERGQYHRYNLYLQHKIQESLRKKKGLDAAPAPAGAAAPSAEMERGQELAEVPEKEQNYLAYLAMLEDLRKQVADDLQWFRQELLQLRAQCRQRLLRVERAWRDFQALKKQVILQAMGSCRLRGGRPAALREVEQLQALEDRKEKEMSAVRLENVQLRQSLVHFATRMRAQEDASEGLHLIDFEQLKIENQTFNEKVEERNEELLKLRAKVSHHVQVVTHVKEKLHWLEQQNAGRRARLQTLELHVATRRDALTRTKQARDALRALNLRLGQRAGLLGREALLRDLEVKVDRTEQLGQRLDALKRHHAGLALSCRGVRQKIREAKAFLPS